MDSQVLLGYLCSQLSLQKQACLIKPFNLYGESKIEVIGDYCQLSIGRHEDKLRVTSIWAQTVQFPFTDILSCGTDDRLGRKVGILILINRTEARSRKNHMDSFNSVIKDKYCGDNWVSQQKILHVEKDLGVGI